MYWSFVRFKAHSHRTPSVEYNKAICDEYLEVIRGTCSTVDIKRQIKMTRSAYTYYIAGI